MVTPTAAFLLVIRTHGPGIAADASANAKVAARDAGVTVANRMLPGNFAQIICANAVEQRSFPSARSPTMRCALFAEPVWAPVVALSCASIRRRLENGLAPDSMHRERRSAELLTSLPSTLRIRRWWPTITPAPGNPLTADGEAIKRLRSLPKVDVADEALIV